MNSNYLIYRTPLETIAFFRRVFSIAVDSVELYKMGFVEGRGLSSSYAYRDCEQHGIQ